jgi:hypothetical protein
MRRTLAVLGLIVFPMILEAQGDPFLTRVRGYRHSVRLDTGVVWTDVRGTPQENLVKVLRVLGAQGIPMAGVDSTRFLVYHPSFTVRRRLAGSPLSRWLSCGSGLAGEYADQWLVSMAYVVQLRETDGGTRMGVSMAAGATDVEGASKPPVACGSTARLERFLGSLVSNEP